MFLIDVLSRDMLVSTKKRTYNLRIYADVGLVSRN